MLQFPKKYFLSTDSPCVHMQWNRRNGTGGGISLWHFNRTLCIAWLSVAAMNHLKQDIVLKNRNLAEAGTK